MRLVDIFMYAVITFGQKEPIERQNSDLLMWVYWNSACKCTDYWYCPSGVPASVNKCPSLWSSPILTREYYTLKEYKTLKEYNTLEHITKHHAHERLQSS